jgi:hypothetical protein
VDGNITRNILHNAQILVGHIPRINHIHKHQRLLPRCPNQDISRLMIRPRIRKLKFLAADAQRVPITESNPRNGTARIVAALENRQSPPAQ